MLCVFSSPENYTKILINESRSVYILNTSESFIMVIVESTSYLKESKSGAFAIEVEKNAKRLDHIVEINIFKTAGSSKD